MNDNTLPVLQVGTLWSGTGLSYWLAHIGVNSWSELSALLTCVVSVMFIADWLWKKFKGRGKK